LTLVAVVRFVLEKQQESISYDSYVNRLQQLLDSKKITIEHLDHFKSRGIEIIRPLKDFGLSSLGRILPEIVIGASYEFIKRMKIPYQATSFLVANTKSNMNGWYVYKIPEQPKGGLILLSGGKRRLGDNIFASTHRIILGRKAILVSAVNLMANKNNIWNWHFFGDHLKQDNESLYNDLVKLETILNRNVDSTDNMKRNSPHYYIIIARSESTFKKLEIVGNYLQNKIAVLNPENNIHTIFVTNKSGFDFASKRIEESSLVSYIATGENFDLYQGMQILKRKYGIDMILNDGGRIMSDGVRREGLLGEERMSLEPFPGEDIFPPDKYIDPTTVAGSQGLGLDGSEIEGSILLHSINIEDEKLNVYIYPLEERKVLHSQG
jgi:hypothetical protein